MKFNYKEFLNRLGYNAKCKKCKHVQYHQGRFISDMILTFTFLIIGYVYLTQEKPYINAVNDCTNVWNDLQAREFKDIPIPIFNNSSNIQDPGTMDYIPGIPGNAP